MVKKDFVPVDEMIPEDQTEESKIEEINSLISNSDDNEEYVVKEEQNVFKKEEVEEKMTPEVKAEPVKEPKPSRTDAKPIKEQLKTEAVKTKKLEARKIFEKPKVHKPEIKKPEQKKQVVKPVFKPKIHKPEKRVEKHIKKPVYSGDKMKQHKKKSGTMWLWIGLAVIIILVIGFLLFRGNNVKPVVNETVNEVAATVNGEAIYLNDINDQYNKLDPASQKIYTKESVLNQTIDEVLLIQEAKNENIQVSVQDLNDELANFKQQNQLTDSQLNDILKQQNITLDQLKLMIEKKLAVRDLLNKTILSGINIPYADILQYYNDNVDKFKQPEKVTAQHILVIVNATVNDSAAKQKINMINSLLNATNFCELVTKYSDDPGSKATCGTYTFGRGEFVPEFENASFNMKINETQIIRSVYGYHLIKKLAYIPSNITPFEQVQAQINQSLHDLQAQKNFDVFLAGLRSKAVIVNYLTGQLNVNTNNLIVSSNTNAQITPKNTSANTTKITANLDDFAKCLTNKSATLYGAYWCPHCNSQKEMFGNSLKYVKYVECAVQDQPQVETQDCKDANISGYPTWIIGGRSYAGEQQLTDLARITGCTLPN